MKPVLTFKEPAMHMLDEMLSLNLLTPDQHLEIGAWVRSAKTPDKILQMPAHLWRALEMASLLIEFDGSEGGLHH